MSLLKKEMKKSFTIKNPSMEIGGEFDNYKDKNIINTIDGTIFEIIYTDDISNTNLTYYKTYLRNKYF